MADEVDTECAAYRGMKQTWELPDDLVGGTAAMRAAGEKWLPKEAKEEQDAYLRRLARSFLKPAYHDGRDRLAARPFAKPVVIKGELPPRLAEFAKNVDGLGSDITTFASALFLEALHRGVVHVLVDIPENPGRLVPAQREANLHAYARIVSAKDMFSWRVEGDATTQIRFRSSRTVADGDWGEARVEEIFVLDSLRWRQFDRKESEKGFTLVTDRVTTAERIPIETLNLCDPRQFIAKPPLEALAWLNLAHWQSSSDQRNCLRFARLAMLFFSGIRREEADKIVPGPAGIFHSENPDARGGFIEHGGKAMEIGRLDLQDLEAAMAILALEPMLQQTGNPTATAKAIDEANIQSNLLKWVRALERSLRNIFALAAVWLDETLPKDFSIDVFDNFGLTIRAEWEIQRLLDMRAKRSITVKTLLQEVKLRGLLSEGVDIAAELDSLANEGPDLSALGALLPPKTVPANA